MTASIEGMCHLSTFEVFAEERAYAGSVGIYLVRHGLDYIHYVKPITMTIEQGVRGVAQVSEPSLELPRPVLLNLMTELWRKGMRPLGVSSDSDKVELMKAHIDDLRKQLENSHTVIRELNSILAQRESPSA